MWRKEYIEVLFRGERFGVNNWRTILSWEEYDLTELLYHAGFTDGLDASTDISLYEYGSIRRPSDGRIVFYRGDEDHEDRSTLLFGVTSVTIDDIKSVLEDEMSEDERQRFESFIGYNVLTDELNNEHLSDIIFSLRSYGGYLYEDSSYDYSYNDLYDLLLQGKL